MSDDRLRLQASGFDVPEQLRQVALYMGLAHFERQALVERIAEQETVDKPGIDARHTHHPSPAHGGDALA
ncbi:hypothetical protein D3C84_1146340 [compost metagenome]